MSTRLSEQPAPVPGVSEAAAPGLAGKSGMETTLDNFREGPSFIEIASATYLFLRKWAPRPWSIWHEQLVGQAWPPWKAAIAVRLATVLWLLGSQMIFALMIIAILAGLAILFNP